MARCLNCIHFNVCDEIRKDRERVFGWCKDFSHTADVVPRSEFDAIRKELARYIKRDILRRYSNDKIATAVVLQMSPESFLEKEADEIVADVERKTLEKMRES